jgi:hypothetical protein
LHFAIFLARPAPSLAQAPMRDQSLRAVTLLGVALVIATELLSAFQALTRASLAIFWLLIAVAAALVFARRAPVIRRRRFKPDAVVIVCLLAIGAILALTATTAWFSPPNSADAMAYHLPRVMYWAEQASVRFFPTPYLNQIMLQPFAEYCSLHLYLLSGSDRFTNLVQWLASLISIAGVSAIAREWGSSVRGQAFAALFCATIPSGILASSGAKNDYVLAMWLVAAVYFALRFTAQPEMPVALLLGAALGLALLTKATAYLYAPCVMLAILAGPATRKRASLVALAALVALALNAPQYARNLRLSGSPLGFDSAQADGLFRWRNESFGWRQTLSNLLRNTSEQLGLRSQSWNSGIYQVAEGVHRGLGMDPNDPATTWRWSIYQTPRNSNHEADAPNPWHLALLVVTAGVLGIHGRDRKRALYALGLACGVVAFCFYLKWQPYQARLFLPLFVLGAPLTGVLGEARRGRAAVPIVLILFLVSILINNARHPLFENWVRPLKGSRSVLHTPRDDQYFSDMQQWGNSETYRQTVDILAKNGCQTVGLDITHLQLEYPLQVLLRQRLPEVRFLHTGVENASKQYRQPIDTPPCAVVCLDCDGDSPRLQLYSALDLALGTSERIGKFVILLK